MLVVVLMQKKMATYKAAVEPSTILAQQGIHTSFPSRRCFQQLVTLPPVQPWSSHYPPHPAPLQGRYYQYSAYLQHRFLSIVYIQIFIKIFMEGPILVQIIGHSPFCIPCVIEQAFTYINLLQVGDEHGHQHLSDAKHDAEQQ